MVSGGEAGGSREGGETAGGEEGALDGRGKGGTPSRLASSLKLYDPSLGQRGILSGVLSGIRGNKWLLKRLRRHRLQRRDI